MFIRRLVARIFLAALTASVFSPAAISIANAQTGTLAQPFPQPSPNAALHYQRGLLLMSSLDESDRSVLQQEIWKTLPGLRPGPEAAGRLKRMLYRARSATDAAGKGSRLQYCDFGIDFSDAGAATVLPHVQPMVELGRLLVLRGAYSQSQGEWNEAAVIYFDALRMGRHLAQQPTLLEAVAGMQIQDGSFYALAHWASACPNHSSVARVFGLFETLSNDLVRPARTLAYETSILAMDYDRLRQTHPDGPWGTTVLTLLGETPGADERANREGAIKACVEAGVPAKVFEDAKSFQKYLAERKQLEVRFAEAAANAMNLPAEARIQRGRKLYQRYEKKIGAIGRSSLLDPAEIGAMFAAHEAKTNLLRLALAVASARDEQGFPVNLDRITSGFGNRIPVSPYDESSIRYEMFDEGKSYQLMIDEVRVGDVVLPRVEFTTASPDAAN